MKEFSDSASQISGTGTIFNEEHGRTERYPGIHLNKDCSSTKKRNHRIAAYTRSCISALWGQDVAGSHNTTRSTKLASNCLCVNEDGIWHIPCCESANDLHSLQVSIPRLCHNEAVAFQHSSHVLIFLILKDLHENLNGLLQCNNNTSFPGPSQQSNQASGNLNHHMRSDSYPPKNSIFRLERLASYFDPEFQESHVSWIHP